MSGILLPYQRKWIEDKSRFKVWLAARQIGKSFAAVLEGVNDSMERRISWVYLSRGERQSRELAEKAKLHIEAYRVAAEALEDNFFLGDGSKVTQLEYRLPNGSRHIFLPANPDTARGYTANVVLDEFAFHADSRAIWSALYPSITRNESLVIRVISTPNGKTGKFWELWDEARDEASVWSRHRTDLYDAVRDGLRIDPEALRAGLKDELAWQQEYLLEFVEENTAYLPYDLIATCEDGGATSDGITRELLTGGEIYLGFDIGRRRDLSVIWLIEKVGDVYWTRRVIELVNTPFSVQRELLYDLLPLVSRACIDETGIGMQLAEEARQKFWHVEGVTFTNAVKSDLAITLRRTFEDRQVRIPIDRDIREDLHSVRRVVTSAGNIRFDAEADASGHADRFWALALALHAAQSQPYQPYQSHHGRFARRVA